MRNERFILINLIICVLALGFGCRQQVEMPQGAAPVTAAEPPKEVKPVEVNETVPKIVFEKVVDDLNEIGPGTRTASEFKFTNAGKGVLRITEVTECCGCTSNGSELTKKGYAPGESGVLRVECRSGVQPGTLRRQVTVNSNDKASPRVGLTIKAVIEQRVSYQPDRLNLLLKKEDANCPSITLAGLDGKPFAIKQFKSTGDCITADVDSSVEATKFVLQPKVDVEKLRKGMSGFIEISLTHPECGTITIPFTALSPFEVNPPQIILFNAEPQKPMERDLWVLSNYGEEFEIESASSQNNMIKVLNQQKIHNGYQLKLQITPPAAETSQRLFTDMLSVSIKGGDKLTIACRGFYQRK